MGGAVVVSVSGFTLSSTDQVGIVAYNAAQVNFGHVDFGACGTAHMTATSGGSVNSLGQPYSISGSSTEHLAISQLGLGIIAGSSVTVTGTPNFSFFAYADSCSVIYAPGATFTGSATGYRYAATANGVIETNGGGANLFPGSNAGVVSTGGQYT
jgi:hypothetical protein